MWDLSGNQRFAAAAAAHYPSAHAALIVHDGREDSVEATKAVGPLLSPDCAVAVIDAADLLEVIEGRVSVDDAEGVVGLFRDLIAAGYDAGGSRAVALPRPSPLVAPLRHEDDPPPPPREPGSPPEPDENPNDLSTPVPLSHADEYWQQWQRPGEGSPRDGPRAISFAQHDDEPPPASPMTPPHITRAAPQADHQSSAATPQLMESPSGRPPLVRRRDSELLV